MTKGQEIAAASARGIEVTVKVMEVRKRQILDNDYQVIKGSDGYSYTVQPDEKIKKGVTVTLLLQNGFANVLASE